MTETLRSLDDVSRSYRDARDAFAAQFCALGDAPATARTVDWLLRQFPGG